MIEKIWDCLCVNSTRQTLGKVYVSSFTLNIELLENDIPKKIANCVVRFNKWKPVEGFEKHWNVHITNKHVTVYMSSEE